MIISSGQILTGKAAETIENGITVTEDNKGFFRTAYKAVCFPDSAPAAASDVNGTWVVEGASGKDDNFLGVIGDDTAPEPNLTLDSRKPVLDYGASRSFAVGDVMTFERNGIMYVLAGGAIEEGDLLKLGANGTFVGGATDKASALGRAYEAAEAGERFMAMIGNVL